MPGGQPLFHPDSDTEDNVVGEEKPNFFGDSDDDMEPMETISPLKRKRESEDEKPVVEAMSDGHWTPRSPPQTASSPSVRGSTPDLVDDDDYDVENAIASSSRTAPPTKKPRLESPNDLFEIEMEVKTRSSPVNTVSRSFFLGEMIVAEAWATCSGKGLLSNGDTVRIHRELVDDDETKKSQPVKGKDKGKAKQMKLTTMLKKEAPQPSKKKTGTNFIVRFSNSKGQEIGRLPTKTSSWVGKLLDNDVTRIQGTVVDCPPKLSTGCHIMLSLRFYLHQSAFISPSNSMMYSSKRKEYDLWPEGSETDQERVLSERKRSLLGLFEALSIRPRKKKEADGVENALAFTKEKKPRPENSKGKAKEVIGEGEEAEEVEVEGEELTSNQLNVIYKKAQLHDQQLPEMDPPSTFTLTLRPYQRQALSWMSSMETGKQDARDVMSMHPLWEEYVFPPEPSEGFIDLCEDDVSFYFNPYSGELSLEFPKAEQNCRGGVLADEMGMGKSIMMSSLIHTNPGQEDAESEDPVKGRRKQSSLKFNGRGGTTSRPTATLLVAPLSLLGQWKAELDRSSKKNTLKTFIYHGTSRTDLDAMADVDDAEGQSVVITSYGTLSSEHAKTLRGGTSPMYDVEWLRVVLDEAHYIKSRHTKTAKACYALKARRRWCLTGTPIVNRLEDLHSLLHFLRDEPWSDFTFFKTSITTPFLNQDPKCLDVVQIVLESVLLRREKTMKDRDGKPIVTLPSKEVSYETLHFSSTERKIYDSIFADAKHAYDALTTKGLVGKNMSNILAMLMRLRRAVLHPSLIRRRGSTADAEDDDIVETDAHGNSMVDIEEMILQYTTEQQKKEDEELEIVDNKNFAVNVLKDLKALETQECPLCLDTMQDPVLIPECHHAGCKECIIELIQDQEEKGNEGFCPVCQRRPVTERSLLEVTRRKQSDSANPSSSPAVALRANDFISSTKLDALIRHLRRLREEDPTFRAIVFSQFTDFLDLIRTALQREGFTEYRLDGQLSQKQRTKVLQDFAEPSEEPKVFAISLKAGGVGLNLTVANHVFMMDSWWNSAVEQQAIDRVHRIGQDKTVFVTHFMIANTIEERILAIQKRKTAIVQGALGGKGKSEKETFENLKMMFAG